MSPTSPDPGPRRGSVIAIIPIGSLDAAKSRLGAVLDAEERRDLVTTLATTTIRAAIEAPSVGDVLVITPDDEVRGLAVGLGARPIRQQSRGLNSGIRQARDEATAAGAGAILILPIDLPHVTPAAIDAVVAALDTVGGRLVALVPDRHGRGTNALLLAPPDVIEVQFGGDSRDAHASAAEQADATLVELDGPLTIDLDTPDDLLLAQAEAGPTGVPRG